MKISVANRVYIGFIVLFLLSVTIGITNYYTIKKQEKISSDLNHTYKVINAIVNIQYLLTDMETGRRGYRCTNQKVYLEPYYDAMEKIGPSLSEIHELVKGDTQQLNNTALLGKSVNSMLVFWSKIRTDESKYDIAEIAEITRDEKLRMDEIRGVTKKVMSYEHDKQMISEDENNKIISYVSWTSPVGNLIQLAFILTLIYLIINELQKRKRAEMELQKTIVKEKQLNELKSRFVSMASHEFRTPLASILASTYLAAKYKTEEDQHKREKHFERIASSVHNLTEILEDLLSVEKLEVGKVPIRFQNFDIEEQIKIVVNDLHTILKHGQQLFFEHKGPTAVSLDPYMLKHILTNLLSNAIKFSKEDTNITLLSYHNGKQLMISVKDSGMGIPKTDMEHLFERFHRGVNVSNIEGTGLGLHIVSKYTKLMDGNIKCISEEGIGTEFIITFPQPNTWSQKENPEQATVKNN